LLYLIIVASKAEYSKPLITNYEGKFKPAPKKGLIIMNKLSGFDSFYF